MTLNKNFDNFCSLAIFFTKRKENNVPNQNDRTIGVCEACCIRSGFSLGSSPQRYYTTERCAICGKGAIVIRSIPSESTSEREERLRRLYRQNLGEVRSLLERNKIWFRQHRWKDGLIPSMNFGRFWSRMIHGKWLKDHISDVEGDLYTYWVFVDNIRVMISRSSNFDCGMGCTYGSLKITAERME